MREILFTLVSVLALHGCRSGTALSHAAPKRDLTAPRMSSDRRAVYASSELTQLAESLTKRVVSKITYRTPRLAFWYFRTADGAPSFLGDSVAQDLATHMVGGARVSVYSRRCLTRVVEEESRLQAQAIFDISTLADIARRSGIDAIVVGTVQAPRNGPIRLQCQVIAAATGEILAGDEIALDPERASLGEPVHPREVASIKIAQALSRGLPEGNLIMAVYPYFHNKVFHALGKSVSESVGMQMANLPDSSLRVVTRAQLDQVLREHGFEDSVLFDEKTQVDVGKLLGANLVLAGWIEFYSNFIKVNSQIVNVETLQVVSARAELLRRK